MKPCRKLISLALVVPVFLLATFCCCLEKAAFAQPQKEHCHSPDDGDADHSDHDSANSEKKDHDCCCSCPKLLSESGSVFSLPALPVSLDQHYFQLAATFIQRFNPTTERFFSFYSPPNLLVATIPLYLQYRVFRL